MITFISLRRNILSAILMINGREEKRKVGKEPCAGQCWELSRAAPSWRCWRWRSLGDVSQTDQHDLVPDWRWEARKEAIQDESHAPSLEEWTDGEPSPRRENQGWSSLRRYILNASLATCMGGSSSMSCGWRHVVASWTYGSRSQDRSWGHRYRFGRWSGLHSIPW